MFSLLFNNIPPATSSIVGKLKSSAFRRLYRRVYRVSLWVCAAADIFTCKYVPENIYWEKMKKLPSKTIILNLKKPIRGPKYYGPP